MAQDLLVAVVDLGFDLVKARHGRNASACSEKGKRGVDVGNIQDAEQTIFNNHVGVELGRELEELDNEIEDADNPLNGLELL